MIQLLFPSIPTRIAEVLSNLYDLWIIITFFLLVIGEWKLLKKMGEKPWKSLIPFYNSYILIKHTWKISAFWIRAIATLLFSILFSTSEIIVSFSPDLLIAEILLVISVPFAIVSCIYTIIRNFRISLAFGKGRVFGVFMVFFYEIFVMILGCGKSVYLNGKEDNGNADDADDSDEESQKNLQNQVMGKETL